MNVKRIFLTKDQEQYIDDNWKKLKYREIATTVGLSLGTVSNYCTSKGYRKGKPSKAVSSTEKEEKKILTFEPPKKIKRCPPDHTNISREQHIERWLNMEV